jgi:uncharacterized alpha-E superfamily protein
MLSRIANSLFWMGRYLERAEHTARYIKVHYYSELDAPAHSKQEFIFESIITMMDMEEDISRYPKEEKERKLLYNIALDDNNPISILSSISYARENARGARDSISSELWGGINRFYHFINTYTKKQLYKEGIHVFCDRITEHCSIVNGYIDNTLLHNETWSLIRLGIHIERACQVTRIMYSKVRDIHHIQKEKLGGSMESYECVTMLKSTEAFDMSKIYYRSVPNMREALEFLILNKNFPKSIHYNLRHIHNAIEKIAPATEQVFGSVEFKIGKLYRSYEYLTIEDIEARNIPEFLKNTLADLFQMSQELEEKYLSY